MDIQAKMCFNAFECFLTTSLRTGWKQDEIFEIFVIYVQSFFQLINLLLYQEKNSARC
jgi:hypothetical protein